MQKQLNVSVDQFIEENNLPYLYAKGVLRSNEDCAEFLATYMGSNYYLIDDLLDYREDKIARSTTTKEQFLRLCYIDIVQAFNDTFFDFFTYEDILMVEQALDENRITLHQLYDNFKMNPNTNILQYVL